MQRYINPRDKRSTYVDVHGVRAGATGSIGNPSGHDPRKDTDDLVYVNINVYNPNNTRSIEMELPPVTRTQPIVNRASDYYCSVVRFEIPKIGIPYFHFPTASEARQFYVTFSDGTNNTTEQLVYVPAGSLPVNGELPIFFVNQFLKSINDAFAACNAQAILDGVAGVTANPPLIIKREDNKLQILVDTNATFQLWVNWDLYNYLQGMFGFFAGYNNTNFKDERIYYLPSDTGVLANEIDYATINPTLQTGVHAGPYYAVVQDYPAFFTWDSIAGIILTTSTLPTLQEYTQGIDLSGNNVTFNILTDFIPNRDIGEPDNSPFIYTSNNNRYIDMKGVDAVSKIDIKAFYIDTFNVIRPLFLPPYQSFSVKLLFIKKSLVNNEYGGYANPALPILGTQ